MKQILLLLVVMLVGCAQSPSEPSSKSNGETANDQTAVSSWGEAVDDLRCRVGTCVLVPNNDPVYSTRIKLVIQIENISQAEKEIRILAPLSGEPLLGIMMKTEGEWKSIGNALIGAKSEQAIHSIGPKEVLVTEFSEGLTKAEIERISHGSPIRCVVIAYGKGPEDPASLYTEEFTIAEAKERSTEQKDALDEK